MDRMKTDVNRQAAGAPPRRSDGNEKYALLPVVAITEYGDPGVLESVELTTFRIEPLNSFLVAGYCPAGYRRGTLPVYGKTNSHHADGVAVPALRPQVDPQYGRLCARGVSEVQEPVLESTAPPFWIYGTQARSVNPKATEVIQN